VAEKLHQFRKDTGMLLDLSFDSMPRHQNCDTSLCTCGTPSRKPLRLCASRFGRSMRASLPGLSR
jgi:hypothetical protein